MEGAQVNTLKRNKENWNKRLVGEGNADREDMAKIAFSYSQICPYHILARAVLLLVFHLEKQGDFLGELKCNSDLLLLLLGLREAPLAVGHCLTAVE